MFIPKPSTDLYKDILNRSNKPQSMMLRIIEAINFGSKYIRIKHQKKFISKYLRIGICPNEICDLASRIKSDKHKQINTNIEKFIIFLERLLNC